MIASLDGVGTFQVLEKGEITAEKVARTVYPNPFQPREGGSMVLRDVPSGGRATVYALDGRLIRTLTGNETGLVEWDGRDGEGGLVKSGVYVISFEGNGEPTKMKVIVER